MNYNFNEYYNMWDNHGVKLTSRIEITKEILDQVHRKTDVCDLIWAINAANQSTKSSGILSNTVMDQIQKLLPVLLNHTSFSGKSSDYIKERAVRHFTYDKVGKFKNRQTKIINVREIYINKKSSERNNTGSVASQERYWSHSQGYSWDHNKPENQDGFINGLIKKIQNLKEIEIAFAKSYPKHSNPAGRVKRHIDHLKKDHTDFPYEETNDGIFVQKKR